MKMKKSLLASLAVASTIGFFTPLTSQAFGLGKLELMSALNEPFKAEIDVTALSTTERENLQVKIASNDEFVKAGLDRSILLGQLQFDIVDRQGKTRILVTSTQAVKEPFLDFLLTATAGSGRLLREYTVLLDPPEYVMAETRNNTASVLPASQVPETNVASTPTRTEYTATSSSGYAVKRSDTLWKIALKTRPSGSVSVHQMMMALLRQNPRAFNDNNVNGLKAGVTLQIPDQESISALSKSAALTEFSEQAKAWKNRNEVATVSEAVEEEAALASSQKSSIDSSLAETTAEDNSTVSEEGKDNEGRLQLVAPDDDVINEDDAAPNVAGNDEIQKLTEQLTLAQETIEAQQQENVDFESRMDAMEDQLETMRRLISIKDTDLARLQSQLEQEDPALTTGTEAELQLENTATSEQPSEAASTEQEGTDESNLQTAEVETVKAATVGDAQADNFVDDASKALNLDGEEVKSLLGKTKQFVIERKLETALGLLLLLLILWLIARRSSREVTWDEAVQKLDKNQQQDEGPVVVQPSPVDGEVDGELDNEEEKTVAELVEQADMFVGYADYVQARNALEQARLQEPENNWVSYKMLFILYKQQHADEFVTLVKESKFDQDSYEWDEIKQWGHELAPNHELFTTTSEEVVVVDDESTEIPSQTETLDVQQDENMSTAEPKTTDQDDSHIEFDLNEFSSEAVETNESATESEPTSTKVDDEHDDLLAFDSNPLSTDNTDTDEAIELDLTNDSLDEDLSFDLDGPDESDDLSVDDFDTDSDIDDDATDLEFDVGDLDDIDEAETKLDLAAAYIDMDDSEGARSILNEVLLDGNDEQKNRARDLLDTLS